MTDDPLILIEAWLDGDLDPAGQQQLEAWLREDPNHLQIFARETHLHRQLHDMLRGQANSPPAEEGEGKDALPPVPGQSPVLGFLQGMLNISGDTPGMTAFLWLVMAALTGMTLMAVLMLVLTIRGVHVTVEPQQQSRQQAAGSGQKAEGEPKGEGGRGRAEGELVLTPRPSAPVARLNRLANCRWTIGEEEQEPAVGDDLVEGQVLRLKSGLAEILFRNGARTLLEGPARLELLSRTSAFLHRGTLTARVEVPSAKGFTLHTPAMKLVDLGTEFGVMVKRDGAEEVHVFRGQVQAERVAQGGGRKAEDGRQPNLPSPASGRGAGGEGGSKTESALPPSAPAPRPSPLVLSANQSLRFDTQQKTAVRQPATPERFVRRIGPKLPTFPVSTGVGLKPGDRDPQWEITAVSTDPDFKPQAAVVCMPLSSYAPTPREGGNWVSLGAAPSPMPGGCRWTLRTQFNLTGFDPKTARIKGQISADDFVVALRLNGQSLPIPASIADGRCSVVLTPLEIERNFVAGINTLEMVIENCKIENDTNPMAILVDWKGTARQISPVARQSGENRQGEEQR